MSSELSIKTDLRSMFGPARDQGARPTCLAFAASDTHASLRPDWLPLSCEYLFYGAQKRAGRPPSSGATLPAMLEALRLDGQPVETDWPYQIKSPACLEDCKPPASLDPCFRREGAMQALDMTAVRAALDNSVPILILMTLSQSFFNPGDGGLVAAPPGELPDPAMRHAVIAVGHGQVNGQTVFLVRNSWGSAWGDDGHAWLSEEYLTHRLFAAARLLEEPDVPSNSSSN